jgi:hypothetical protein
MLEPYSRAEKTTYLPLNRNMTLDLQDSIVYNRNYEYHWLLLLIIEFSVLIGNFCMIFLILCDKNLYTNNTTKIVLSLSITDLLMSILVLPFTLYSQVSYFEWRLGFGSCILWLSSDIQLTTTSIFHLVSISYERYLSVLKPIKFRNKMKKRITRLIVLNWSLSFVFCTLPFFILSNFYRDNIYLMNKKYIGDAHLCGFFSRSRKFLGYATFITFWLPLGMMIFLGIKTMGKIGKMDRRKSRNLIAYSQSERTPRASADSCNDDGAPLKEPTFRDSSGMRIAKTTMLSVKLVNDRPEYKINNASKEFQKKNQAIRSSSLHSTLVKWNNGRQAIRERKKSNYSHIKSNYHEKTVDVDIPKIQLTNYEEDSNCNNRKKSSTDSNWIMEAAQPYKIDSKGSIRPANKLTDPTSYFSLSNYTQARRASSPSSAKLNLYRFSRTLFGNNLLARKELQAQKTLTIVLIVFVLCYLPLFTFITITSIIDDRDNLEDEGASKLFYPYDNLNLSQTILHNGSFFNSTSLLTSQDHYDPLKPTYMDYVFNYLTWLGYISAAMNPFLHLTMNNNFKNAFKNFFARLK